MSFDFYDLLNQGKEAADSVTKNNNEISEVLTSLKESISNFLEFDIKFREEIEYEARDKATASKPSSMFFVRSTLIESLKPTGYTNIYIEHEETGVLSKVLLTIKRSSEGYPVKVVHEKNHYSADNQSEFAQAIGAVVSNAQTHLMFRSFQRAVEEKRQQALVMKS